MAYENQSHETLGSDLLAVLNTLKFPEEVLGKYWTERLAGIEASHWYPVSLHLELQQQVLHRGGRATLVQMGRQQFRDSHQGRLAPVLNSASDVLTRVDRMYRHSNRGQKIGGWELLSLAPGRATLRKSTPHHCALEEGLLHEALQSVGAAALISQSTCVLTGGKVCELELKSHSPDERWLGSDSQNHA
jgi:hypothetical protein